MLRISLRTERDLDEFCSFLRAVHVAVVETDGRTVIASVPGANSDLHERRELTGYVVTWNALHPAQIATLEA